MFYDLTRTQPLQTTPTARCSNERSCTQCIGSVDDPRKYLLNNKVSEADFLVAASLSVHIVGKSSIMCGRLDYSQVDLVQAVLYATEQMTSSISGLSNLSFGSLIIDSCGSSASALTTLEGLIADHLIDPEDLLTFISGDDDVTRSLLGRDSDLPVGIFSSHMASSLEYDNLINAGLR